MKVGRRGEVVIVVFVGTADWFSERYDCWIVLPRLLAAFWSARLLRESTHRFMSEAATMGNRNICSIKTGIIIMYSMATCGMLPPPRTAS
jgi:hypothetical protein